MARCVLDETGLVAKAVATIPSCAVKVSLMLAISAVWVFTVLVESNQIHRFFILRVQLINDINTGILFIVLHVKTITIIGECMSSSNTIRPDGTYRYSFRNNRFL